ncbi:ankyrin repeat-containing domain protein [Nemania sp. NC0429]|nr:ankyrin repeat-containing domain protein [Nemania sp. NC0429]
MASIDWERHKAIILQLYMVENRPLSQVITYMQEKHNFAMTKHKYHSQLKKWGAKKNLRKKDWQHLPRQLEKRIGKQSEITFLGATLSPQRVRRATQRYSIPTASEFGTRLPSPDIIVARAQTPIIIEKIEWPPLPWFDFKNKTLLPFLRDPPALLKTFFAALGPEQNPFQQGGITRSTSRSLYETLRNPWELHKAILRLNRSIPDDSTSKCHDTKALVQKDSSSLIAAEVLKLIFFRLSNNIIPGQDNKTNSNERDEALRVHDQFVLCLVEAISRTHPEMLTSILSGSCVTANAIKESVFGSAVRRKNYTIVLRLLESGVNPDQLIIPSIQGNRLTLMRKGRMIISLIDRYGRWNGMKEAAFTHDTPLGRILLNAGASVKNIDSTEPSPLEIVGSASANDVAASDGGMEFAQLIVEHRTFNDNSMSNCSCTCSRLIPALVQSIMRGKLRVAKFLISKAATVEFPESLAILGCRCIYHYQCRVFCDLNISFTPLNMAIVSGNEEIISQLLQPLLSNGIMPVPLDEIKEAVIVSCLVGDANTASKLLMRYPEILAIDVWARGVTPLAAAAWNQDNTIADMLLGLGAHFGPTRGNEVLETLQPTPIHVAASFGNMGLVTQLINRGADCNVCYRSKNLQWLVPRRGVPLELALRGNKTDTAKLFISQSRLTGGELVQAIRLGDDALISDLISAGADVLSPDRKGRTILETAVTAGNSAIISLYFSSGGRYTPDALASAVYMALKTKDYSVVKLLASHRPTGEINALEAASLVRAIDACEWGLVFCLLDDPFLPGPSRDVSIAWTEAASDLKSPLSAALLSQETSVINAMLQRGYVPGLWDIEAIETVPDVVSQSVLALFPLNIYWRLLHAIQSCNIGRACEYIKSVDSLEFFSSRPCKDFVEIIEQFLERAVSRDDRETMRLFLDAGADVVFGLNDKLLYHLLMAVNRGNMEMVELLLDRGATLNPRGKSAHATALQEAAKNGGLLMAKLLISRGADINLICGGTTALECAAEWGRVDMAQLLLASGASLDGKMRLFYVRSVALAFGRHYFQEGQGSYALANYLKDYGSWSESDQILYERCIEDIHYWDREYLQYDDVLDRWYIHCHDNSDGADEPDETGEVTDVDDGLSAVSMPVERHHFGIVNEHTTGHGLATSDLFGSERIVELEDVVDGVDASQFDISRNTADQLGITLTAAGEEWEGPFSGPHDVDDINEQFGVMPFHGYNYY